MKIKISSEIHKQIREIVFATDNETGMCLFGAFENGDARITHIAGPGKKSKHEKYHYTPDNSHYEDVYNELLKTEPKLEHIGEFHVHPGTMSELSCGDHHTIKKVLKTYERFIAGVIVRLNNVLHWDPPTEGSGKSAKWFKVYPVYFTRDSEVPCELVID